MKENPMKTALNINLLSMTRARIIKQAFFRAKKLEKTVLGLTAAIIAAVRTGGRSGRHQGTVRCALQRACLLALTAAAAVIAASPAANAKLVVAGQDWPKERFTEFVTKIGLTKTSGPLEDRARFVPNLVHFMTIGTAREFRFDDEDQLKSELTSQYIDEHMAGLGEFQRLTHDARGAQFITQHFKANKKVKSTGNPIQDVLARDLDRDSGAKELNTIFTLLDQPQKNFPDYMDKRPKGNLWIFRTMSQASADHLYHNFNKLLTGTRAVVPLIATQAPQAAQTLRDVTLFSAPDLEHALNGHFGDLFQAITYNRRSQGGDNVLVGFKIKEGAELVMYSPLVMVLTGVHKDMAKYKIAEAMQQTFGVVNQGNGSDGIVKGYLSVKHEARGDFSFGLSANPASIVLFCLLVSEFQIYGNLD
jgi:hypothetical protein